MTGSPSSNEASSAAIKAWRHLKKIFPRDLDDDLNYSVVQSPPDRFDGRVRSALDSLSRSLLLVQDAGLEIREEIEVGRMWSGILIVSIANTTGSREHVATLGDENAAASFVLSRLPRNPDHPWDAAFGRRLLRPGFGFMGPVLIEPGVNAFVELLEAAGGATFLSCEGHPHGFHLVVRDDQHIRSAFQDCPGFTPPQPFDGLSAEPAFRVALTERPDYHETRDRFLRSAYDALSSRLGTHAPAAGIDQ